MSSLSTIRLRKENENDQIRNEIDMIIRERVLELTKTLSLKLEIKNRLQQKLL